ncbi:MAG: glycosyltransferase [Pseudomonadaceae bacterium]|nr:glycosyltransferase [Pseudomonadaceae bacterium]
MKPDISVVVRTYNEQAYLDELLTAVRAQHLESMRAEIVIVDSGSTDDTLRIAEKHDCNVVHIPKEEFTFGRSLNLGCENARGDYLVFVSGHCVPCSTDWLKNIVAPLKTEGVSYCYGNQVGRDTTRFSEKQVFAKYFDPISRTPQQPYFVNNANAALLKSVWQHYPFDEHLTGLEDMHLGKRLIAAGEKIDYADNAAVYHIHNETWAQVRWRYEREALALQQIDPHLHMSKRDLINCIVTSVLYDSSIAVRKGVFLQEIANIIRFRCCQYWGSFSGSHSSRKLTAEKKRRYFYPGG